MPHFASLTVLLLEEHCGMKHENAGSALPPDEGPDDVGESNVRIAPGILTKELCRRIRIADKWSQDPGHLN